MKASVLFSDRKNSVTIYSFAMYLDGKLVYNYIHLPEMVRVNII